MFDTYTRWARLLPACLAALPGVAFLVSGVVLIEQYSGVASAALGAVGCVICGMVRDAGRRVEPALWKRWGGSPTVRRMRWRHSDHGLTRSLHEQIEVITNVPLPSPAEERADPKNADGQYEMAIMMIRARTRDRARFNLLFRENVEYGFRRNCYGLCRVGIAISVVGGALSALLLLAGDGHREDFRIAYAACGTVSLLMISFWVRVVDADWVLRAAQSYSLRFVEAVYELYGSLGSTTPYSPNPSTTSLAPSHGDRPRPRSSSSIESPETRISE